MLRDQVKLFPTPNTMDMLPSRSGEALDHARRRGNKERTTLTTISNLRESVVHELLPTPQVDDSKNSGQNKKRRETLAQRVHGSVDWGRFAPAIERWEKVLGRPAPEPTVPDGKDGQRRLSALFTEWLMGLPDGWVTDAGLTRNEQLKACGNGVVPQQAALALRRLLND